ncbi:hypothetical protein D3C80_1601760 [compost metagenome]
MADVEKRNSASVEDLLEETDDLVRSYILRGRVPPAALIAWRVHIRLSGLATFKTIPEKRLH